MTIYVSSLRRGAIFERDGGPARNPRREQLVDAWLYVICPDAGQPVREGEDDCDEQTAKPEQPQLRKRLGETGLGKVHDKRAVDRAEDGEAPPDRGIDHHFDR